MKLRPTMKYVFHLTDTFAELIPLVVHSTLTCSL